MDVYAGGGRSEEEGSEGKSGREDLEELIFLGSRCVIWGVGMRLMNGGEVV